MQNEGFNLDVTYVTGFNLFITLVGVLKLLESWEEHIGWDLNIIYFFVSGILVVLFILFVNFLSLSNNFSCLIKLSFGLTIERFDLTNFSAYSRVHSNFFIK
jgi:hypothetical protein